MKTKPIAEAGTCAHGRGQPRWEEWCSRCGQGSGQACEEDGSESEACEPFHAQACADEDCEEARYSRDAASTRGLRLQGLGARKRMGATRVVEREGCPPTRQAAAKGRSRARAGEKFDLVPGPRRTRRPASAGGLLEEKAPERLVDQPVLPGVFHDPMHQPAAPRPPRSAVEAQWRERGARALEILPEAPSSASVSGRPLPP